MLGHKNNEQLDGLFIKIYVKPALINFIINSLDFENLVYIPSPFTKPNEKSDILKKEANIPNPQNEQLFQKTFPLDLLKPRSDSFVKKIVYLLIIRGLKYLKLWITY